MPERKKILVVDDDKDLTRLIRLRLLKAGYDVFVVPDAVSASQESKRFNPDLVILDMMLPAGGGGSVLRRLRSSLHTAYVPVLILSGISKDDPVYKEATNGLVVEGYLQKPFEEGTLLSEAERILGETSPP